ncbi:MAG TPA: hypothetical protein VIJ14_00900, partial [Rhabdochlamydiaceae bacterium]
MKYKLAKELKDAGFTQNQNEQPRQIGEKDMETVSLPTLFELIEACGDRFASLIRHAKDGFEAKGWKSLDEESFGVGATPEEAVAKLW